MQSARAFKSDVFHSPCRLHRPPSRWVCKLSARVPRIQYPLHRVSLLVTPTLSSLQSIQPLPRLAYTFPLSQEPALFTQPDPTTTQHASARPQTASLTNPLHSVLPPSISTLAMLKPAQPAPPLFQAFLLTPRPFPHAYLPSRHSACTSKSCHSSSHPAMFRRILH